MPSNSWNPPKNSGQIRSKLDSIRTGGPQPLGPRSGGFEQDDNVALATFHDEAVADGFQDLLAREGIGFSISRGRTEIRIKVRYGDLDAARKLLAEHRAQHPERQRPARYRDRDGLFLGGLIGLGIGSLIAIVNVRERDVALLAAIPTLLGICFGVLFDKLSKTIRETGRPQFGFMELALIVSIFSLIYGFIQAWSL